MNSYHNIAILAGGLRLDYHVIFIANMVFDHRLTFDHQSIGTLLLHLPSYLDRFRWIAEDFQRFTCCNTAHDRNAKGWLYQFDATAFLRFASNKAFFLQHLEMIINMARAGNFHCAANLAVRWRHTLLPRVFNNE